jgi:hypothetical protein
MNNEISLLLELCEARGNLVERREKAKADAMEKAAAASKPKKNKYDDVDLSSPL